MPSSWKKTNTLLIPKPKYWNKDIDITRPIVLIETARKIFTKIMTNRLKRTCCEHQILKGNNCSVLKGTLTHVPINILTNIIEDARVSQTQETWLVLQDMHKAYDSVGWYALLKSLRRIKMSEKYINLLRNLYTTRWSSIITSHGLTKPHHIEAGLDQGETHAPILWRIFYDSLLCKVNDTAEQTGYQILEYARQPTNPEIPASINLHCINHLAFVDDTVW